MLSGSTPMRSTLPVGREISPTPLASLADPKALLTGNAPPTSSATVNGTMMHLILIFLFPPRVLVNKLSPEHNRPPASWSIGRREQFGYAIEVGGAMRSQFAPLAEDKYKSQEPNNDHGKLDDQLISIFRPRIRTRRSSRPDRSVRESQFKDVRIRRERATAGVGPGKTNISAKSPWQVVGLI